MPRQRQHDKDKARASDVEIGCGGRGLQDGNLVVLAGATSQGCCCGGGGCGGGGCGGCGGCGG
ncbi:hypothetical protein KY289_031634 [Solanum tuberosum]|nr:hypothetical protein KY289_031634 [Solanum tuberosum]